MKTNFLWLCQFISAFFLGHAAYQKILAEPGAVWLFEQLGMEPTGRIIIGLIEAAASLLLLHKHHSVVGALLAVAVMLGALLAHLTVLGLEVAGDGGLLFLRLVAVLLTSSCILLARRRGLPLVGPTL